VRIVSGMQTNLRAFAAHCGVPAATGLVTGACATAGASLCVLTNLALYDLATGRLRAREAPALLAWWLVLAMVLVPAGAATGFLAGGTTVAAREKSGRLRLALAACVGVAIGVPVVLATWGPVNAGARTLALGSLLFGAIAAALAVKSVLPVAEWRAGRGRTRSIASADRRLDRRSSGAA